MFFIGRVDHVTRVKMQQRNESANPSQSEKRVKLSLFHKLYDNTRRGGLEFKVLL